MEKLIMLNKDIKEAVRCLQEKPYKFNITSMLQLL